MLLELRVRWLCQCCFLPLSACAFSTNFSKCVCLDPRVDTGWESTSRMVLWTVSQSGWSLRSPREDPILGISFRAKNNKRICNISSGQGARVHFQSPTTGTGYPEKWWSPIPGSVPGVAGWSLEQTWKCPWKGGEMSFEEPFPPEHWVFL